MKTTLDPNLPPSQATRSSAGVQLLCWVIVAVLLWSLRALAGQTQQIELTLKGQSLEYLGWVSQVAVAGHHAYVGGDSGLHLFDISDSANPRLVGSYGTGDLARGVAVVGNLAYVGCFSDGGFQVIDIADPANPRKVGGCATDQGTSKVVVSGNYAYVSGTNVLQIIDISDPANPRLAAQCQSARGAADVSGNLAYLSQVVDVSNPGDPRPARELPARGSRR